MFLSLRVGAPSLEEILAPLHEAADELRQLEVGHSDLIRRNHAHIADIEEENIKLAIERSRAKRARGKILALIAPGTDEFGGLP